MLDKISNREDLSLRILSIDPGTINLGFCLGVVNLSKPEFHVEASGTIDVFSVIHKSNEIYMTEYSKNIAMVESVYNIAYNLASQFNPDWVICESPYMNSRFPLPYALLTLCTQSINKAVLDYSNSVFFDFIDPASVKKGVGVKGNTGDKNLMTNAVIGLPDLRSDVDLTGLDEHAIDSIAIGYAGYKNMLI